MNSNCCPYIAGFMTNGTEAVNLVAEPTVFDKGLIFVKDTNILLSGDKWTLVVNIALDDYATLISSMKMILKQIRQ
jgi:hypothetical protein